MTRRTTWDPREHTLRTPYVPAPADWPETIADVQGAATRVWFVVAMSVAAVLVATAVLVFTVAVSR